MLRTIRTATLTATTLIVLGSLAACSSDSESNADDTTTTAESTEATEAAEVVSYSDLLSATFNSNHGLDEALDEIAATGEETDPAVIVEDLNALAEEDGLIFRVDSIGPELDSITCSVAGDRYLYSFENEESFGLYLGEGTEACESPEAAEAAAAHVLTAGFDEATETFSFTAESAEDQAEGDALAEEATALAASMS